MQKERTAIRGNAAAHLKPLFKRRERAPESKDFDDDSIHQRAAPRGAVGLALRMQQNEPGDVGRMKRQNTARQRSIESGRHGHYPGNKVEKSTYSFGFSMLNPGVLILTIQERPST